MRDAQDMVTVSHTGKNNTWEVFLHASDGRPAVIGGLSEVDADDIASLVRQTIRAAQQEALDTAASLFEGPADLKSIAEAVHDERVAAEIRALAPTRSSAHLTSTKESGNG